MNPVPADRSFRVVVGRGVPQNMRNHLLLLTAMTTWALAACDAETGPSAAEPVVVVETIGDTTVVRTLSGSVWDGEVTLIPEISVGELNGPEELLFGSVRSIAVDDDRSVYIFDDQAQEVRVFDSAGVYVETLGGRGEGPGEFSRAEAIALLPDGRLVVRDPGNTALEVFVPGTPETQRWRYEVGGLFSASPLYTDMSGRTFLETRDLSRDDFVMHIIVFGPDGTQIDTLPEPSTTYEPPVVTAERGPSSINYAVPFSPGLHWTVHPSGHLLTGFSSDYRIDLARDDGVLRIERAADPAPVHDEERAYQREGLARQMHEFDPEWSWNGPPIPEQETVLSRPRARPGRPHLGQGVDRGIRGRERGLRPGRPHFGTGVVERAGALRCLRTRRDLSGCRVRPGELLDLPGSGVRRGLHLGRDPGRTGGGAGGAVHGCGGGVRLAKGVGTDP